MNNLKEHIEEIGDIINSAIAEPDELIGAAEKLDSIAGALKTMRGLLASLNEKASVLPNPFYGEHIEFEAQMCLDTDLEHLEATADQFANKLYDAAEEVQMEINSNARHYSGIDYNTRGL